MTLELFLAVAAVTGWAFGALALGLWLGERGRRKDAQRREGILKVDPVEPAVVMGPAKGPPDGASRELNQAPASFIQETMAETGCTEEEAAAEWRRLVAKSTGEGAAAWVPELP